MSEKQIRFLFVRAFRLLKGGGPVPPLGILCLASVLRERFGQRIEIEIIDAGRMSEAEAEERIKAFRPNYAGIGAMSCEANVMSRYASMVKKLNPGTVTMAGGPHTVVARERLLQDENLDYAVIGEAEETIVELLESLENNGDAATVNGIAFRNNGRLEATAPRPLIADLDSLPFPAWDLIDYGGYSKYQNWSGVLKGSRYASILTSRGCPYGCRFCHTTFGKTVRFRSPESVFDEIRLLRDKFGADEIHVLDDVFNIDNERAVKICSMIIDARLGMSFSFPNGLRADVMTDELLAMLKKAGTHRINYGFETTSARLQKEIGKNLDVLKAKETIRKTSEAGIVVGAYFMIGFPDQTREEIEDTINYAASSPLDAAYFFKATFFPGGGYDEAGASAGAGAPDYANYHFYSVARSSGSIDEALLNDYILMAQEKFFLNIRRLARGFKKSPRKSEYAKNAMAAFAALIQARIFRAIAKSNMEKKS